MKYLTIPALAICFSAIALAQTAPSAANTAVAPRGTTSPIIDGPHRVCSRQELGILLFHHEPITTEVTFVVTTEGDVKDIEVSRSSGYPSVDKAAIICVSRWHYRPATNDGAPIAVPLRVLIDWGVQ